MQANEMWLDLMPIRRAGQMKRAVEAIAPLHDDAGQSKLIRARAKAWLVYLYALAKVDSWEWDTSWRPRDEDDADKLLQRAKELAGRTASKKDDYDVLWAETLLLYSRGRFKDSRQAFVDATEGKSDEPKLLAEAAESRLYIGETFQAIADLEAIETAFPGRVPRWFYWILAWARCNAAFLHEAGGKAAAAVRELESARAIIDEKVLQARKPNKDFDYDTLLLKAGICLKLADLSAGDPTRAKAWATEAATARGEFERVVQDTRGHPWTLRHEMTRARFDASANSQIQSNAWTGLMRRLLP